MLDMLGRAYSQFENTESARVGIIRGAGKHFTSGMDMAQVTFDAKLFPVAQVDPVGQYNERFGASPSPPVSFLFRGCYVV